MGFALNVDGAPTVPNSADGTMEAALLASTIQMLTVAGIANVNTAELVTDTLGSFDTNQLVPIRTDACGVTNGSLVITDASIKASDAGRPVVVAAAGSTGLAVGAFLGFVSASGLTAGTSFTIDRTLGSITTGSLTLQI